MTKYLKIPGKTYKSTQLNQLQKDQGEEESEIDRIYKANGYSKRPDKEDPEISSVITWMRIPLEDFQGCSYDASTAIEESDLEFELGEFTSSIIHFKDGISLPCAWTVEKLEDILIQHDIVHPSIKNQEEIL